MYSVWQLAPVAVPERVPAHYLPWWSVFHLQIVTLSVQKCCEKVRYVFGKSLEAQTNNPQSILLIKYSIFKREKSKSWELVFWVFVHSEKIVHNIFLSEMRICSKLWQVSMVSTWHCQLIFCIVFLLSFHSIALSCLVLSIWCSAISRRLLFE